MSDTTEDGAPERVRRVRSQRMEAFSDGVFAIAITLLVLDIAVPTGSQRDLLGVFFNEWPAYLAYVVSFATIGAIWLGHDLITEYLHSSDSILLRLNLLLLLVVSFLPFPTRLVGEYLLEVNAEKVAVTIYGLTLLAAATMVWVLWQYALRADLVRPDTTDAEVAILTRQFTPGLLGYVILLVVGLFQPVLAVIGYLALAVFILVPLGRAKRRLYSR
jgi:uncharacterized membrane protein